jgi:hypothetical protein
MRTTPQPGGYLADMIARWLGMGGGGSQGPQSLFPPGVAGPGGQGGTAGMAPPPGTLGVPGIGPLGPNASMYTDYGGNSASMHPALFGQFTTGGRGDPNYTNRPGTPGQNVPRIGVSPQPVPGVNPGVPGSRAAQGLGGPGSMYGGRPAGDLGALSEPNFMGAQLVDPRPPGLPRTYGGGAAPEFLAAILGGGGRY